MKELEARLDAAEKRIAALECALAGQANKPQEDTLEADLVNKYGACVNKKVASEIIGVTRATIYAMLADGRITAAMGSTCVDVRSIARYIRSPKKTGRAKA